MMMTMMVASWIVADDSTQFSRCEWLGGVAKERRGQGMKHAGGLDTRRVVG